MKHQCKQCNALFDRDTEQIVNNLEESHKERMMLGSSKGYYDK